MIRISGHYVDPSILRKNPFAIDCGMFKGAFSIKFIESFGGHILALEPNPRVAYDAFKALLASKMMDRISMFQMAIWDDSGPIDFNIMSQGSSIIPRPNNWDKSRVMAVTFNNILQHYKYVDFVKMDVEGVEVKALAAAKPKMMKKVRQLSIELHPDLDPTNSPDNAQRVLEGFGYKTTIYRDDPRRPEIHGIR